MTSKIARFRENFMKGNEVQTCFLCSPKPYQSWMGSLLHFKCCPSSNLIATQQFKLIILPTTLPGSVGRGGRGLQSVSRGTVRWDSSHGVGTYRVHTYALVHTLWLHRNVIRCPVCNPRTDMGNFMSLLRAFRRKPNNCLHDTHQMALTINSDALLLICYGVRVFSTDSQPEKRQRPGQSWYYPCLNAFWYVPNSSELGCGCFEPLAGPCRPWTWQRPRQFQLMPELRRDSSAQSEPRCMNQYSRGRAEEVWTSGFHIPKWFLFLDPLLMGY